MPWTQTDTSFKKLQNKRITTSTGKGIDEEKGASALELYLPDIKTDLIPGTPPGATTAVLSYTGSIGQTLAVDTSVPSNLTWFATSGYGNTTSANDGSAISESQRLGDWISDKYDAFGTVSGAGYEIKVYDKDSNLITKADPSDWLFDYQTGILVFNNANTAYGAVSSTGPFRIVGYRYIGSKGIIPASFGGSGFTTYTKGDILVGAGATFIKFPLGTDNYILTADSSQPSGLRWSVGGSGTGMTLNGLTATTQYFQVGVSGNSFNIVSSGSTHTFNIPIAGTGKTGLITPDAQSLAGRKTFSNGVISSSIVSPADGLIGSDGTYFTTGGTAGTIKVGIYKSDTISRFTGIQFQEIISPTLGAGYLDGNIVFFTDSEAQDFSTERMRIDGKGFVTINQSASIGGSLILGSPLEARYGGTGYTTYTKGDIIVGAGGTFIKFPVGTDNYVLAANSSAGSGLTWKVVSAGAATTSVAPSTPSNGDFWYDTSNGSLSIYYTDPSSSQWVEIAGAFTGNIYNGNAYTIPYYHATGIALTGSDSFTNVGTGISILYTAGSSSTSTGALVVSGGVGIGGSLYTSTQYSSSISGVAISNGVIYSGSWAGSTITGLYGGTGYTNYTKGDILVGAGGTFLKLGTSTNNYVLYSNTSLPSGVGWTWVTAVGIGTTAPTVTHNADLWWNSTDGSLNVYYSDGDTDQWVEIAGGSGIDLSQPVHITSTVGSTNVYSGALTVDGGVGIAGTLHTAALVINGTYDVISADVTLSGTGASQVLHTLDASSYRSAKYMIQISHAPDYEVQEVLVLHDSSNTFLTQYAQLLTTNNLVLATYDADLSGGLMRLLVTPAYSNTTFKLYATAMRN